MHKLKIIAPICLVILFGIFWGWPTSEQNINSILAEKLDFDVPDEYRVGKCVSKSMLMAVEVYVVDEFNSETKAGGFYPDLWIIVLRDTGLSTIAHEVSHFLDYALAEKQIEDRETRAYLQGYFTECIYEDIRWGLM